MAINGDVAMWLKMFTIGQSKNQHLFLTDENRADLETIASLVGPADGKQELEPVVAEVLQFTAKGVADGFARLKSRRVVGKLVFSMETGAAVAAAAGAEPSA